MIRVEEISSSDLERTILIQGYFDSESSKVEEYREKLRKEIETQFPEMESLGLSLKSSGKSKKTGKRDNSTFPYFELETGEKVIPGSILQVFGNGFHGLSPKSLSTIYSKLGINHESLRVSKNGKSRKELGIVDLTETEYFKENPVSSKSPEFKKIKSTLK